MSDKDAGGEREKGSNDKNQVDVMWQSWSSPELSKQWICRLFVNSSLIQLIINITLFVHNFGNFSA